MLSRSAIVKLKAILVIDLIIIGIAAGTYFYLQNQGVIAVGVKPAQFSLTNLTIDPANVTVGEAVQISANVTNIGDLEGNQTFTLEINSKIKESANVTLAGGDTQLLEFTVIEMAEGNYTVKLGDLEGSFKVNPAAPETSKIILSSLKVDPYEAWVDQPITISALAENPSAEQERLTIRFTIDGVIADVKTIELEAGAEQTVQFVYNVSVSEGKHAIKLNTLSGSFTVVKTGYHTLTINRSGGGSTPLPFTLNGKELKTAYTELLPVGEYSLSVPTPFDVGTGVLEFSYWSDGVKSSSRTFTLDRRMIIVATYTLISGYASCPSLYIWNGTGYSYVTDVSNSGWLGYIDYIKPNGDIVFGGGNPWDYVKLDKNLLAARSIDGDSYFDIALFQQWDELFYLDTAYMMAVDHPIGTDVYTTMTNYINQGFNGQIYTVNGNNLLSPVSAVNEKGENVLQQILEADGIFTPGINGVTSPSWNNITLNQLTLDLGDLSAAQQIKLIIKGMVDWGPAEPYYEWIDSFKEAASQGLVPPEGAKITPPPYMEVKDANGNWIRIPQDRQIPIPSDYTARTFAVSLTGLFPTDVSDYQIRFTNFWNVTFDYIGIDTTQQQDVIIQKITPTAILDQVWDTQSTSSGVFTRYGDVTQLMQSFDDMFVIGRQGDRVMLKFPTADLQPVPEGMVRDYFFFVAAWFKDPPENWGYGFEYTVDPLPFMGMTGFPYPFDQESYPYDATHLAYLQEYNTRVI